MLTNHWLSQNTNHKVTYTYKYVFSKNICTILQNIRLKFHDAIKVFQLFSYQTCSNNRKFDRNCFRMSALNACSWFQIRKYNKFAKTSCYDKERRVIVEKHFDDSIINFFAQLPKVPLQFQNFTR